MAPELGKKKAPKASKVKHARYYANHAPRLRESSKLRMRSKREDARLAKSISDAQEGHTGAEVELLGCRTTSGASILADEETQEKLHSYAYSRDNVQDRQTNDALIDFGHHSSDDDHQKYLQDRYSLPQLYERVRTWSDRWGMSACWTQALHEEHERALKDSDGGMRIWLDGLKKHAHHGRMLIRTISELFQRPLPNHEDIRHMLATAMELMDLLYRGIGCLQARLSIIN